MERSKKKKECYLKRLKSFWDTDFNKDEMNDYEQIKEMFLIELEEILIEDKNLLRWGE